MDLDSKKTITQLRTLVVFSYLVFAPYYLSWRLGTFNPDALVFSWLVWAGEVFGYLTAVLHVFMVGRLTSPVPQPAPEGYSVDVFIPTYNESVNLLRHTLLAAIRMDYPHRTWLLDDGNRPEMAALAKELDCRYLARVINTDAKAGNLNNALSRSRADFVAVFDADHVPSKDFLTKTLGFFHDTRVAFVQTPQDFYNLDSYQHRRHKRLSYVWTEQSLFFRVIQRGKDRWNAAFFCGSCAVLRRSALDQIGGIATGTLTEDFHTSICLHKKGYKSIYYPESLAFGLAPDSVQEFLAQRRRWGQGAIQVWRKEGILFSRGLTLAQRLNYLASILTYFDGWTKAIFYIAPIVVLTTGVMPISVLGPEFFLRFIPFYVLCFWAYEEAGRGYGGTLLTEQYNMAHFATFVRATLSGFKKNPTFTVTSKSMTQEDEHRKIFPQFAVLGFSIGAIVVGSVLWTLYRHLTLGAFLANVVWASINLGLAGAVVRFTLGKKHRRNEYRFPIPLPATITTRNNERLLVLIENISADGCHCISEVPLEEGRVVAGKIFLPTGELPFNARVKRHLQPDVRIPENTHEMPEEGRRPERKKLHYGLLFAWRSANDAAQLENFLYGSDFQWRVLDLQEEIVTPVAWLVSRFRNTKLTQLSRISPKEWLPVIYRDAERSEKHEHFGVVSRTDWVHQPAKMILFEALPVGTRLEFLIFGKKSQQDDLQGEVAELQKLETSIATVYVARLIFKPQVVHASASVKRAALHSLIGVLLGSGLYGVAGGLGSSGSAYAQEWIGMTGAEVAENHNRYLFAGAIVPLISGAGLGQGWVQRYWLDGLEYRFDADGEKVQARSPGMSAALGYQQSGSGGFWGGYAGLAYRHTTLNPGRRDIALQGGQSALQILAEIDQRYAQSWRFSGAGQYAFGPDSHWARAKFLRQSPAAVFWQGLEFIIQGDPDYRAVKAGYVLDEWSIGQRATANFKVGLSKTEGLDTGGYIGVEFVRVFGAQ